jgi:hypothetical protein
MTQATHGWRRCKAAAVMTCAALFAASTASADTLTLMWDYNTEPEVTGYLVYIGTQSGIYSQTVDVQNIDRYVFSSATPGQSYCFAVAAYAGSLVSPLSTEVCGTSNNHPTLAQPGNRTTRAGTFVSLQLVGSDPDGSPVTYSATGLPAGLSVSQSTGLISGIPTTVATYDVTVRVSDGVLTAQQSFSWVIQPAQSNTPPTLANPGDMTSSVGQQVLVQLQASDADGDPLSYTAVNLPAGLQIASATGRITGSPTTAQQNAVTVAVTDGRTTVNQSFIWTVRTSTPTNTAPVLTQPGNQTTVFGQAATLQLVASDANGDVLTYSATGLPPGLQITPSTGRIAGTPTVLGSYEVRATVSDGGASAQVTFIWSVNSVAVPVPPSSTPPPVAPESIPVGEAVGRSTARQAAERVAVGSVATRPGSAIASGQTLTRQTTAALSRAGTAPVTTSTQSGTATSVNTRSVATGSSAGTYTITAAVPRYAETTTTTALQTTSAGSTTARSIARETESTNIETQALVNPAATECCVGATGGSLTSEPPRTAVSAPATAAPVVTIETPVDRATFAVGTTVIFSAVARDVQDGDLSARIVWTSSRDGRVGTGRLLHKELSAGTHMITASVTDASGRTGSTQITILISQ